ncbi:FAD-dependent oxidoreductase [Herbaspirillum sp. GCM10030257]|uniref:FAD-dependent oxidoreductase n=1 Tax=Herbaspirillum sp. GCM10030257 TaxID=3273393 RepID=UPI003618D26C
MTHETIDVAIIGAGPSGMSAAIVLASRGLSVVVLDEQDAAGGQIYRGITQTTPKRLEVLGPDYAAGQELAERFIQSGARCIAGASVWQVTREHEVNYLYRGVSHSLQARQVILCTGAMERPFPIPGWTLPGVLTAGAAQILLKSADVAPAKPVVLAGCGPLLYLLGWQYVRAGIPIRAVVDTTDSGDYRRAARHLGGALAGWRYLKKGLTLMRTLKASGVPFYTGASKLAVTGTASAEALRFDINGKTHQIKTDLVLLHQGVIPNTQFTWSLRAKHTWDQAQLCWTPSVDDWGQLDIPGIYVAGDGRGIGGAVVAALQGQLTGLAVAHQAGKINADERDRQATDLRSALRSHLHIRPFLDALYRPKQQNRIPSDDVIVCRCEEVTAGAIRNYVDLGCVGPNQTKAFGRCGMGPCQGRLCGITVTEVIADKLAMPPAEVGYYRIRPPIKPLTLGELAGK